MLLNLLALIALWFSPIEPPGVNVGQKARDFTLEALHSNGGRMVSLNQLQGKVVLLDFWATWCEPCRDELPQLDRLQKKYARDKFAVMAVNVDNKAETARAFLDKYDIDLVALWDRQKAVVSMYDVQRMPSCYLIDATGKVRFIHYGYEEKYVNTYEEEIDQLLAGLE